MKNIIFGFGLVLLVYGSLAYDPDKQFIPAAVMVVSGAVMMLCAYKSIERSDTHEKA